MSTMSQALESQALGQRFPGLTGARSGADYIASLRDGRSVWIDGEHVKDVTVDPRFRGAVQTMADLYDKQHDPAVRDSMTFPSPSSNRQVGLSFIQPKSADDLRRRREMVKVWMDSVGGMMGRTPDFLNISVSSYASVPEVFAAGGEQFGRNIVAYHEYIRENDLALTHSLVAPDVDKSKPMFEQPPHLVMQVVKESDAGIYVTGARSVATLGPLANEVLIFPSPTKFPLVEASKAYAVGFAAAADTPGMKMVCRPSLAPAASTTPFADNPISARMDEMDAVLWFDNAFIPWERVFLYRNLEVVDAVRKTPAGPNGAHQSSIRALAKMEFFLGIAYNLVESNRNTAPQVMGMLAEIVNSVETLRALLRVSEVDCRPGPHGTVVPNDEPLQVAKAIFPAMHQRMIEILQVVGSGNLVVAPSTREFRGEAAGEVEQYCAGANMKATQKVELLRLAWDVSCSSYAGRQNLYEKFFSGDPFRNAATRGERYSGARELQDRVWGFLKRNEEWDGRISAAL